MKALLLAAVTALMMAATTVAQQSTPVRSKSARQITQSKAEDLLRACLKAEGYDTKAAPLDIEVAESSRTGDIWERIECREISCTAIADEQREIREGSGLSHADLTRLRKANPCF